MLSLSMDFVDAFIRFWNSLPSLVAECFYHERVLGFIRCFPCIYEEGGWFLFLVGLQLSPPLFMEHEFQDPQWVPETLDSTHFYISMGFFAVQYLHIYNKVHFIGPGVWFHGKALA